MARGVRRVAPGADVVLRPLADGGEGFLDAVVEATGALCDEVDVRGPFGQQARAPLAHLDDVAWIEAARGIGLGTHRPTTRDAARADSRAVGTLVSAALARGARSISVGVGGTATTDGGAGMLRALGAGLYGADGQPLAPGGAALGDLHTITLDLDPRLAGVTFVCAHDVSSPLLGPAGAAATFGPQKGADPRTVQKLEQGLTAWSVLLREQHGLDICAGAAAGAGGGLAAALVGVLGAREKSGLEVLIDLLGLEVAVRAADLVLTGEGSFDAQSLRGKVPWGLAQLARGAGVPVIVLAGRREVDEVPGIRAIGAIADHDEEPMVGAAAKLERLTERVVRSVLWGRAPADV